MQGKMFRILVALSTFVVAAICQLEKPVDYSGHRVLTVYPASEGDLELIHGLRKDYGVDLWNEPRVKDVPVMMRLSPDLAQPVMKVLRAKGIDFKTAIKDVQSAIVAERIQNAASNYTQASLSSFDFGKYHQYDAIVQFMKDLTSEYPNVATLQVIGNSYENRPIYAIKVSSDGSSTKPAVMLECGIHAREHSSVAACIYFVNELVTKHKSDAEVSTMLDKYEFNIVVEANPDGYIYTWTHDRLWRKTRSRSSTDWLGVCRGVDANRNFDVEHCGVGTSRKPCDDLFCGDYPFSESESRAIRDMVKKIDNLKCYFSVHAFSQFWMTPHGTTKKLPPNYSELERVAKVGANALSRRYGTIYKVGSIANIIYEAAGSSVDYVYEKENLKMAYALELRDTGRYGFFLPAHLILPTCEETYDGLKAAILALN